MYRLKDRTLDCGRLKRGAEMERTVYLDLLFLINFSMDFLCFFLTSKLLSRKLPTVRALAASVLGGIYADAALFVNVGRVTALFIDAAACLLMCTLVYAGKRKKSDILFCTLVYFAISMALGGFMTAIFNLINGMGISADAPESAASDGISVWLFALLAAVSAVVTLIGSRIFRRKTSVGSAEVEITYGGRSVKLRALTDSGNLLSEPISGRPCIVADISSVECIIPRDVIRAARNGDYSAIETMEPETVKNIRLVPAKTAAGEGMLIALRADRITLDSGKGAYGVDAMIALSDIGANADGSCALVPSVLLS